MGLRLVRQRLRVRFLYHHPRHWYLSLTEQRDVIETPIEGVYDINGWDLRKALRLAQKGNPVLFEWLSSPIRYVETPLSVDFRKAVTAVFDPTTAYRHYYNMALKQWRGYFGRDFVQHKKYFYVVRPLLACSYLLYRPRMVPMRFPELIDQVKVPAPIRDLLTRLLEEKRRSAEAGKGPPIPELHEWIEKSLARLRYRTPPAAKAADPSHLDAFFLRHVFKS
jgi:predicted nucleotidyltransferase